MSCRSSVSAKGADWSLQSGPPSPVYSIAPLGLWPRLFLSNRSLALVKYALLATELIAFAKASIRCAPWLNSSVTSL